MASVEASARRLGARGQWLLALPASYVAGVQVICRSLIAGHDPVVVTDLGFEAALATASVGTPLFTSLVPTQLHRLLEHAAQVSRTPRRLHTILLGGGPIDPALRARAEASGLRLVATYGASETAGGCVYDGHAPRRGGAGDRHRRPRADRRADDLRRLRRRPRADRGDARGRVVPHLRRRPARRGRAAARARTDRRRGDQRRRERARCPPSRTRLRAHPDIEAVEVLGVPDEEWGTRVVAFVVGRTRPARVGRRGAPALVGTAAGRRAPRAAAAAQRQGRPPRAGGVSSDPRLLDPAAHEVPRHHGARGCARRGEAGWGEWSPFLEYGDDVARPWLACADEAAAGDWPEPVRDRRPRQRDGARVQPGACACRSSSQAAARPRR